MPTIELTDLERMLNRVHEWTRAADQKANVLAVLQTAIGALFLTQFGDWFTSPPLRDLRWLVVLSVALWLISIVCSAGVLFARTGRAGEVQDSTTFFGHISNKRKLLEYRNQVNTITPEALRDDFIDQVWISARICALKHKFFKYAVATFLSSAAALTIAYIVRGWRLW